MWKWYAKPLAIHDRSGAGRRSAVPTTRGWRGTLAKCMTTSSFSALLAICAGNSPVTDELFAQRPVTRSFDALFDLRLNNGRVKNCEAGDLRRHRAHYDVTVMIWGILCQKQVSMTWITSRSVLRDVITYPCLRYLLLAQNSSYISFIAKLHCETCSAIVFYILAWLV